MTALTKPSSLIRRESPVVRPPKGLIFALPRTGSTSLYRALNTHTEQWCAFEPFNLAGGNESRLKNKAEVCNSIRRIWGLHHAIKHVWHPSGWPFAGGMRLNRFLLTNAADKVILLWRRNILKRVVSFELSMQVNTWHVYTEQSQKNFKNNAFKALDLKNLSQQIADDLRHLDEWRTTLDSSGIEWMEMTYEDLYGKNGAEEAAFRKVFNFFGMPGNGPSWRSIAAVIDDPKAMMNDHSTYRKIPNSAAIEAELGADTTGWLFH